MNSSILQFMNPMPENADLETREPSLNAAFLRVSPKFILIGRPFNYCRVNAILFTPLHVSSCSRQAERLFVTTTPIQRMPQESSFVPRKTRRP